MGLLLDALSALLLAAGGFFVLVGGIGLLRFPDFFTRPHAAGVTDTLGAWLILAGLMIQAGPTQNALKLVLILLFLIFTSPTASHALAKAALHGGLRPRGDEEEGSQSSS